MKKTLIAGAVFVVLLVAVLATRERQVSVGVPRLELAPLKDEIVAVEVAGAHQAQLKLSGGGWTVGGHPADETQAKALVDALKAFRAKDFVTEKPEKLAEYELDEVKGTKVTVSTAAGPQWSLVFGKTASAGGSFVREAKSNAVFTSPSPAAFQLKRDAKAWRKKSIPTVAAAEMVRVVVTQKDGAMTLVNTDGTWALEPKAPPPFRFDPQAAQRLVQQLASLQAQDFLDANPGTEDASVEFTTKDGKKRTLHLGVKQPDGQVPVTVDPDPQVYLVPQWVSEQLLKRADDLRDTTLLALEPEKVTRVALTVGAASTVLTRDGATWKVQEPKKLPAGFDFDPATVLPQLARWRQLKGTRAVTGVSDAAAGLGAPSARLELTDDKGVKQTVTFGAVAPSKALYVKGTADSLLYEIAASEKQQLERGLELFKRRPPPPNLNQANGFDQLPPEIRKQLEAQFRAKQGHP